jgi:hypothetical protein
VDAIPNGVSVALKVLVRVVGRFFLEQPVVHWATVSRNLPIVIVSQQEDLSGIDLGKIAPVQPGPVA